MLSPPVPVYSDSGQSCPLDWSVSFEFRAATLKRFNPLPYLLQLLLEVHGLRAQSGALYSVMAELYSNALEHGVLGLDSSLKRDARALRSIISSATRAWTELEDGYVRVHLQVAPRGEGGCLVVRVEDSGKGFDVRAGDGPAGGCRPFVWAWRQPDPSVEPQCQLVRRWSQCPRGVFLGGSGIIRGFLIRERTSG